MRSLHLAAVAVLCSACGPGQTSLRPAPPAAPRPAVSNVHLRSAMDADPSVYLGRFVSDDAPASSIDEAMAAKLACSTHFTVRKVDAGGVEFDHVYQASSQAFAGLNIPQSVPITASARGESKSAASKSSCAWCLHLGCLNGSGSDLAAWLGRELP